MNKELSVEFIYSTDGSVSLKVKPGNEYSLYEIYYAYKLLERILRESDFDWSVESKIQNTVKRKDE